MNDWDFLRRVLIVAGVVIGILCLWQLSHAFLLFFGAMLFAIVLGGAADLFVRLLSMPRPVALGIVILLILVVVGSFAALYGAQIVAQTNDLARKTMNDSSRALQQWLVGQLIAMGIVGVLVGAGVWYIGLPSPMALGVIAALGEFVPILGPIVSALPALFLALSMDWTTVAWTLGLFFVVQQLESNMIMPLIQNRMVSLPPAIPLFAVLAFGLMFGLLGVVFATPLAVLTAVLVSRLYLREVLEEPVPIPGQPEAAK